MEVHPAICMKTKGRENTKWIGRGKLTGELPWIIPYRGGGLRGRINFSMSHPCLLSPVPFHKNEGASGDIYEKKGTEKFSCANAWKHTSEMSFKISGDREGSKFQIPGPDFWFLFQK